MYGLIHHSILTISYGLLSRYYIGDFTYLTVPSIKAHKDVFENEDPEAGIPTPHIRDLHVYDSTKLDVDEILANATVDIVEYARQTRL